MELPSAVDFSDDGSPCVPLAKIVEPGHRSSQEAAMKVTPSCGHESPCAATGENAVLTL